MKFQSASFKKGIARKGMSPLNSRKTYLCDSKSNAKFFMLIYLHKHWELHTIKINII